MFVLTFFLSGGLKNKNNNNNNLLIYIALFTYNDQKRKGDYISLSFFI